MMRRVAVSLAAVFFCATLCVAQTATPSPSATQSSATQSNGAQASGATAAPAPAAAPVQRSFGAAAMQMLMAPKNGKFQFMLRFTPPRSTFADDMTPDETQAMMGQYLYWKQQMQSGNVILLGAVNGKSGIYGMAIVECASEAEAKALGDNDPSVKAGVNKVEMLPMRVLLKKE